MYILKTFLTDLSRYRYEKKGFRFECEMSKIQSWMQVDRGTEIVSGKTLSRMNKKSILNLRTLLQTVHTKSTTNRLYHKIVQTPICDEEVFTRVFFSVYYF